MNSWRQQHQIENEDEALAKALELSRLEPQGSQGAQRRSTVKLCQTEFKRTAQASGPDFMRKRGSQAGSRRATPLCLPNNCKWDSSSGKCIQTGQRRTSLYVLDEALENLRRIRDAKGQEFTVVVLASEGIDAANGQGLDDNQIFTLTVLLASVLIYNPQGVPTRRDLEGLEDVTQAIPRDCSNIKDYFLKKDDYHKSAIAAKDEIEAVFFEFHPALMKEQEQYLSQLKLLKDYDESLTEELAARAFQEQEKQKLEEQQQRLLQENREVKREMKILSERQKEERENFREQMDNDLRAQREQMDNMMEANMQQAQKEREQFMQENQELRNQFLDMQKINEENIKMIKKLAHLVEMQQEEKI
ncbi:hypothetical protein AWC38_SpisGene18973 [Stylophora pistillata]|uniref:Guanylate-binding protein N-terminal domain-containing protein n=1 Tax=Stylophora pistillata TaxID=50429 RepID=A0A2B4RIU9_STYPI|nr:hypothetical protein AWC38_SpisGene18973 [Stylophora pistillata]